MSQSSQTSTSRRVLVLIAVAFVATMAAYANNYAGRFFVDDLHHIVNNPALRSLRDIPQLFVDPTTFSGGGARGFRPVLLATFSLNYAISGYEVWSYHLFNNLLHSFNTVLIGLIMMRLFGVGRTAEVLRTAAIRPEYLAIPCALWFGLHPIQGEAVNYLNARSNLLSTAFYLLAVWCFLLWRGAGRPGRTSASRTMRSWELVLLIVLMFLSVASKEIGFTLPATLLIIEVVVLGNKPSMSSSFWRPHAVLWTGAVGFWVLRSSVLSGTPRVQAISGLTASPHRSTLENVLTQSTVVVGYLRSVFWPDNLSLMRFNPAISEISDVRFLTAAIALIGFSAFALACTRKMPLITAGWAWWLIALAPTSMLASLVIVTAERRCYLAMGGLVLIGAGAAVEALRQPRIRQVGAARLIGGAIVLIGLLYAPLSLRQNEVWADEVALFEDAVAKYPTYPRAWLGYVEALLRVDRLEEAEEALEPLIALDPTWPEAHHAKGKVYFEAGRFDEAESAISYALEIEDRFFLTSGLARRDLARVYIAQRRWDEAEHILGGIAAAYPNDAMTLHHLGLIAAGKGEQEQALAYFERAIAANPEVIDPRLERALTLHRLGWTTEAQGAYEKLLIRLPDNTSILYNLALLQEKNGDFAAAAESYQGVVDLDPDHFRAVVSLATLLDGPLRRSEEAIPVYRHALELCPDPACRKEVQRRITSREALLHVP